ncbi:hypothetical protein FISHEDRAFT_66805 [Fistulina hepatica ATCC 64428]|uniref:Uncharacterized protein n=1 Tax=Fistulina hepatica ATCC 64428 TaxID=1128425 RepID=A0A0D7A3Y9_9AGAR|nr:hypothetical protein FISHEDRAFT_66805 [Fistulina hepatica ATCC 64428]
MSSFLPASLSPHICILSSQDLDELLSFSHLPPLPEILQSFSPLQQVTTRTTSLTSVTHPSFCLRFSSLRDIEIACKEDEERRAARAIDWISARINARSQKWVSDAEAHTKDDTFRPPWWNELRRCAEGDHVPSKMEAWNHPAAVILAVSTMAPNPLQAISALHTRPIDLPSWVDTTHLQYTLIIHPPNSPLSDEEAGALLNAARKQYGLHSFLLQLALPSDPLPAPVPVPAPLPRLPPPPASDAVAAGDNSHEVVLHTIQMSTYDIQQTAKFVREFVVMSLVPWMEKCVVEWNENFSSSRRLPSRLFSSTRRLFGSPSPSPSPLPGHHPSSSLTSPMPTRAYTYAGNGDAVMGPPPPPEHRRLAEFATLLGDYKLATVVWETLRKESKGGSDILPLLLAPSLNIPLYAAAALSSLQQFVSEASSTSQMKALVMACRWESGIRPSDFAANILEGERWLVWAAGNSEEVPAALLLAHAALLSERKLARRRSALWYVSAAQRLEKCGARPLTMYFLRRAHALCSVPAQMSLSPLFWESEKCSPQDVSTNNIIMDGIRHPLGRLLYKTGDIAQAVKYFLQLLHGTSAGSIWSSSTAQGNESEEPPDSDKLYLEDFRVTYLHMVTNAAEQIESADFKLPFQFCQVEETRFQFPRDDFNVRASKWQEREELWTDFRRSQGHKEQTFWIDLVLRNPLNTDVTLSNVTVRVRESNSDDASSSKAIVEVGIIDQIILGPKDSCTIPISVKAIQPGTFIFTHVTYDFLQLLPCTESLSSRGKRLHDTPVQRQKPNYAPDIMQTVEVADADHSLSAIFIDDCPPTLIQGEMQRMTLHVTNSGRMNVGEVWLVAGADDVFWVDVDSSNLTSDIEYSREVLHFNNSIFPKSPLRLTFANGSSSLSPNESLDIPLVLVAHGAGNQDLSLLLTYRETDTGPFHSSYVTCYYEVQSALYCQAHTRPSWSTDHLFLADLELENTSKLDVQVTQVSSISPSSVATPLVQHDFSTTIAPNQVSRFFFGVDPWESQSGCRETNEFVTRKLRSLLLGEEVDVSEPPPIDILCSHVAEARASFAPSIVRHLLETERRNLAAQSVKISHPLIPSRIHRSIFPIYNPRCIDFLFFWRIPSTQRSGYLLVSDLLIGASHSMLSGIIDEAESGKVKRSMYAETQRERLEVLDTVRTSPWNAEMNPLVLSVQKSVQLEHSFARGALRLPVSFTVRNFSLTHACRRDCRHFQAPSYCGRITFRGSLEPGQLATVRPSLWITRPGVYGLGGWQIETTVLAGSRVDAEPSVRQRYLKLSPENDGSSCVMVSDTGA